MSELNWIKKMDKADWALLGIYFSIAFLITFFAEWSEEDIPLLSKQVLPLLQHMVISYVINILAVVVIVFWVFNSFFHDGRYFETFFFVLVILIIQFGFQVLLLPFYRYNLTGDWLGDTLWGMIDNFTDMAPVGLFLMAKQYYSSQTRFVELERNQKDHELKLLKAQVDPHFLFNNLNILDILIQTDPLKASEFTKRLSSLYRYMIRHKNEELVSLEAEWNFSADYIYLLEQRFEGLFLFDIDLENPALPYFYIPPASIQTLLENVVKHNTALPNAPIQVSIYMEKDLFCIANTVKLKNDPKDSMGTGLDGLQKRVKLLTDRGLVIAPGHDRFIVKIPLLRKLD
ncbi:MAG: histidine kinase [Saprospiraceae bacterium]|nr:histidine kinase [Saprospiraceae bacterium]